MLNIMQEKRFLKRPRLGPPDVYPQDAKQKEDELTSMNVKHGFTATLQVTEEFGTARNCNVTASKVGAYFNAILAKREELMTLPDSGRKKQQINPKDNFWPVTVRSKATLDVWFKDLAGNKPLTNLAKKAPSFNKKEEIFPYLCENQVSMQKSAWFIKLSSAYTVAVSEAKIKKRQMPDPATEWTGTIIKFMKDLLPRLHEHYHQGPTPLVAAATDKSTCGTAAAAGNCTPTAAAANTVPAPMTSPAANTIHSPAAAAAAASSTTAAATTTTTPTAVAAGTTADDYKTALKQWQYCTQLCKYMYEESLLDRHEFLNWILDLLDKMRSQPADDSILKLFLPITLQYMYDFVQSERLSRRLSYLVCKKLAHILNTAAESKDAAAAAATAQIENLFTVKTEEVAAAPTECGVAVATNPIDSLLAEQLACPHHRDLIMQLSTILQVITIECPTALVWCGLGENRAPSALVGSPLDHLPIPPSALPMPVKCQLTNARLKTDLNKAEADIRLRSTHAESKWCTEKWQNKDSNSSAKILATLDGLDTHCFERMDTNNGSNSNNLDTLYGKVFAAFNPVKTERIKGEMKELRVLYDPWTDAPIVQILCEWAVSCKRWGEHRAMAVAWLLDKRQSEVVPNEQDPSSAMDDKESVGSGGGGGGGNATATGIPVFQSILMHFLDNDAPVLNEHGGGGAQNRAQFTNLVHLFCELIRHDVFSHDAYMCTLISRGDLLTGSGLMMPTKEATPRGNGGGGGITGTVSNKASPYPQGMVDDEMFPKMDFDDSNVDDDLDKILQNIKEDQQNAMDAPDSPKESEQQHQQIGGMDASPPISRHFLYAKHFPLSQDDPLSQHDCNQRYILLYGVGKERDERKHAVKKMWKGDIFGLFQFVCKNFVLFIFRNMQALLKKVQH